MRGPTTLHNPAGQQGFSLLEIIVVVAIIGVMVSVIGVSIGKDADRLARLESERFQIIVNEVRDEAVLAGQNYFLELDDDASSYQFTAAVGANRDDHLLRPRKVERGVKLSWEVLDDITQDDEGESEPERALISPLGEITPFRAEFEGDEFTYLVFVDDQNKLVREEKNSF